MKNPGIIEIYEMTSPRLDMRFTRQQAGRMLNHLIRFRYLMLSASQLAFLLSVAAADGSTTSREIVAAVFAWTVMGVTAIGTLIYSQRVIARDAAAFYRELAEEATRENINPKRVWEIVVPKNIPRA